MSGRNLANFLPYETVPLSVTNSSSSVAFKLPASWTDMSDVMIYNAGSKVAYVNFGNSKGGAATISAQVPGTNGTTGATPVPPGYWPVFNKNAQAGAGGADTCAAICGGSDSTTLYFTSGRGS